MPIQIFLLHIIMKFRVLHLNQTIQLYDHTIHDGRIAAFSFLQIQHGEILIYVQIVVVDALLEASKSGRLRIYNVYNVTGEWC